MPDALAAIEAGANAIGLNFVPQSRRHITREVAREIVAAVGDQAMTVGVFWEHTVKEVLHIADETCLASAQLHGQWNPEALAEIRQSVGHVIRAVTAGCAGSQNLDELNVDVVMLDAPEPGGGVPFDWSLVGDLTERHRILLAGGLRPENVARAIETVGPWGVDVASGVELQNGRKDPAAARLLQVPSVEALFTAGADTDIRSDATETRSEAGDATAAIAALHEYGDWVSIRHLRSVLGPETPDPRELDEQAQQVGLVVQRHGNQIRLVPNPNAIEPEKLVELRELHLASSEPLGAQAEILYAVLQGHQVPDSDTRTALINAGLLTNNGMLSDDIRHSVIDAWTRSHEHVPTEQLSFLEAS